MQLTEQPVHLRLFVRVTERWRNVPRQLAELGYAPETS
jgi:GTPase Era involved in 16S rRNA processing